MDVLFLESNPKHKSKNSILSFCHPFFFHQVLIEKKDSVPKKIRSILNNCSHHNINMVKEGRIMSLSFLYSRNPLLLYFTSRVFVQCCSAKNIMYDKIIFKY